MRAFSVGPKMGWRGQSRPAVTDEPPGKDSRRSCYSCVPVFLLSFSCLQDPHCMRAFPGGRNEWTQACCLTRHDCVLADLQAEKLLCSLISPFVWQLAPSSPSCVLFLSLCRAVAQCGPRQLQRFGQSGLGKLQALPEDSVLDD